MKRRAELKRTRDVADESERFVLVSHDGKTEAASVETALVVVDRWSGFAWRLSSNAIPFEGNVSELVSRLSPLRGLPFRVPSVLELQTLIDWRCVGPATAPGARVLVRPGWYASASPYLRDPTKHWAVDFQDGRIAPLACDAVAALLPVCGPLSDWVADRPLPLTAELKVWADKALF